jgi:hypothetical protein
MKRVKRQLVTAGYICSILVILFGTLFMAQVVAAADGKPDLRWLDLEFYKVGVGVTDNWYVGDTLVVQAHAINGGGADAPFGFFWGVHLFDPQGAQVVSSSFVGQQPMGVGDSRLFFANTGYTFGRTGQYTAEVFLGGVTGEQNLANNSLSGVVSVTPEPPTMAFLLLGGLVMGAALFVARGPTRP